MTRTIIKVLDLLKTYLVAIALVMAILTAVSYVNSAGITPEDIMSGEFINVLMNPVNLAQANGHTEPPRVRASANGRYMKNDFGQTYGGIHDVPDCPETPDIVYPELFEAIGVDGTFGYVYTSDLNADTPNTPEEAVAYMKKIEEEIAKGVTGRTMPLYEVDGRTVIGEFKIKYN